MAHDSEHKSAAELQREIELQRSRVENTIDQIQAKLSPGQLVDELLAYTKGGGGEFVSSLQRSVTANPLPVALLGVSLAWLMAKPAGAEHHSDHEADRQWDNSINRRRGYTAGAGDDYDDADYPVAIITGTSMRRVSMAEENGRTYSEFADEAGTRYRAYTDPSGKRAGHFMDQAGNKFRGFTDSAGKQIEHFRDEAGNLLEDAANWASHTWQMAREKMHDARDAIGSGGNRAGQMADGMRHQLDSLNHTIMHQFRDQPLVGGALAFALGAALGSALPHTEQEDALLGKTADKVKEKVGENAAELYEQGKEKAAELYENASEKVGEVYQQAKDGITSSSNGVHSHH